jgi:type III restriction enzyme
MSQVFFENPILISPHDAPTRHYALSDKGQPINATPIKGRRKSDLISPVPAQTLQQCVDARRDHRGGYGPWAFAGFTDYVI